MNGHMLHTSAKSWQWRPLGDQSFIADCESEKAAFQLARSLRTMSAPWRQDVVQAYRSVAIFFDSRRFDPIQVRDFLEDLKISAVPADAASAKCHMIPCCYGMGMDLGRISEATGLALDDIIRLHQATAYTVYAIGFCPGFPYLGYLPSALQGVPRFPSPRLRVEAGSVGLTGNQTGIYTESRPGGWNLVGRTPLELVHVADGYFPLRTGDRVQFRQIDANEFAALLGERL